MSKEEVQAIVDNITLPIDKPHSLHVSKEGEFPDSYDPVVDIEVLDHSINIRTGVKSRFTGKDYVYNHSFDSFDKIEVVNEEE
jgi:hypothetical protein